MSSVAVRMLGANDVALFDGDAPACVAGVDAGLAASLVDDPSRHVAIAVDAGRVVGVAFATQRAKPARELVVADVVVAPSHRRRGVGRRLLAALLHDARGRGCVAASLEAGGDDVALRALCAAAGGVEQPPASVHVSFDLA